MTEHEYKVPKVGDGSMENPFRPKYSDEWLARTGRGASVKFDGDDYFIAVYLDGTDEDYAWLESHEDVIPINQEVIDGE